MKLLSAYKLILPLFLIFGTIGAVSIGSLVAQPTSPNNGEIDISTPEPTPNPVKDAEKLPVDGGGIDPELVQIEEPDNVDLDPSLNTSDDDRQAKPRLNEKDAEDLKKALAENSDAAKEKNNSSNTIPFIPINLLFPQGNASVTKTVQMEELPGNSVIMLGFNRETGQKLQFRVNVGTTVNFENLSISVAACYKSKPEYPNESWAYVDVVDRGGEITNQLAVLAQRNRAKLKEAQSAHRLRKGWIIASSPTVTPIDHSIYDLTLIRCEGGAINSIINQETKIQDKPVQKKS